MQEISFSRLKAYGETDKDLTSLIKQLYIEDEGCEKMSDEKIRDTFKYLNDHPEMGTFLLFYAGDELAGYALLINFWSNEYGGIVVHVDELYVKEKYRSQGIAHQFFAYMSETCDPHCVALFLEVTPNNKRAKKLYREIGFSETGRSHLIWHMKRP
ncbi:MAG TPA: GNAT family N-acetyltransferase [Bacteroidales bacterium]|nr:GNAT family N-acetyltransferase [Bacteroidales bacterium]